MKLLLFKLLHRLRLYCWKKDLWLLSLLGAKIHPTAKVFGKITWIGYPTNLVLASNVSLNTGVHLNLRDKITVGKNAHISSGVQLHTGKLVLTHPREHVSAEIVIGDDVWLAAGVVVSAGVVISNNVIVAANSVVLQSLESGWLYGGVPAKKIKPID